MNLKRVISLALLLAPLSALGQTPTKDATHFTGRDASEKIQAAIDDLPSTGGSVDARGLNDSKDFSNTILDPHAKSVTLLFGPHTYRIKQIVLRSNLHIFGAGEGQSISAGPMTILLADCAACDGTAAISLPDEGQPIQGVVLEGFRLYAKPSNKAQIGMNFVASRGGGGLWYSTFRNLCIGACDDSHDHFRGGNLVLDGTNCSDPPACTSGKGNGTHQFLDFHNIQSFRNSAAGHALDIWGLVAQLTFDNCEFDGPSPNDGGTNIWIGDKVKGLLLMPDTLSFNELTCQMATVCASINGAWNLTFHQAHVENDAGVFLLNAGVTNHNIDINIEDSFLATSGSTSAGSGYILKVTDTRAAVTFENNYIANTPDTLFAGNVAGITGINNFGFGGNNNSNIPSANRITSNLQTINVQSNLGATLSSSNVSLGGSWGKSPSVTDAAGTGQTATFTIHVGSGSPHANPTVTVAFPNGFNSNVLCTLEKVSGSPSFEFFKQTTIGKSSAIFTYQGTPPASETLSVFMRCGP